MKKHIIRTVVALLIVALIGYLVYFLWFKPSPDITTFNKLASLNDYEEKLELGDKFDDLRSYGTNSELALIVGNNSLADKFDYLHQVYNYYYNYTSFASKVKSSSQKAINKKITAYQNAIDDVVKYYNEAKTYREKIGSNPTEAQKTELNNHYSHITSSLLNADKALGALNSEIKNFVITYVYSGQNIIDIKFCELDILQTSVCFALDNFDKEADNAPYNNSVAKFYSKYSSLSNQTVSSHAQIMENYITLNISTTKDGNGETYIDKIIKLKYSDQRAIASGTKNPLIFGAGDDDTLFNAAKDLFTFYGIN